MKIAIVGGGIGGMTLALSLHDAGITDVDVYESTPAVQELGVGINVLPHAGGSVEVADFLPGQRTTEERELREGAPERGKEITAGPEIEFLRLTGGWFDLPVDFQFSIQPGLHPLSVPCKHHMIPPADRDHRLAKEHFIRLVSVEDEEFSGVAAAIEPPDTQVVTGCLLVAVRAPGKKVGRYRAGPDRKIVPEPEGGRVCFPE